VFAASTGTVPSLIAELARAGIKIRLAGDGQLEVTAPSGQLSEELHDRIVRDKPGLIAWLARAQASTTELPTIMPDRDALFEPFPPSDLQMSFLVGSQEGFEYHVRPHQYMEFELGEIDPARFERALNQAIRRHRASIVVVRDDMQLQTVRDPGPVPVPVSDLRGMTETDRRTGLERVRASMDRTELPLDRWPWMDVRISLYDPRRARLHINNNNFFSDARGTSGLLNMVMRLYQGSEAPPSELDLSYRDCVLALAALEESALGQASKKYWCDRMAGWPGPPALPLVRGADTRARSVLERRELIVSAELWASARKQARAWGLTPTSLLCGAYAEVIAYWSGSRHFLINNMITHRLPLHPLMGEILGNFASLYPLEFDWRHREPFARRVRRLQAQMIADMQHVHWSGVKVLQMLNQVRGTPGRAVCPFAVGSALFAGQVDRPGYSLLETPQVVLDCEFWEQRDGSLWVVWDLIEKMFPAGIADAMQAGYLSVLTQLARDEDAWQLEAFDLHPAEQRERVARLNRTAAPVPPGLLHDCLAPRAAELARKPCVITSDGTLTYAGLHHRSERLAARLQGSGVAAGDLVAVVLPKGWEQVVAVFGTLAAGAAYVPVDPGWPADRIRYVLADTHAAAIVTSTHLSEGLGDLSDVPVLAIDAACAAAASPVGVTRKPDDLAYVIYTSGSTGRPKGAMLGHRGPLNTITDVNRRFGISQRDVLFGISSLCFDLSVYDIFGAIAAGATLVLPAPTEADPAAWVRQMLAHGVTVWNSAPALMELVVAEAAAAGVRFPSLRTVLLSGDWIPVRLPERIREVAPNARVISLGGATEASIWSICFPIDRQDPEWASIPYGKPLDNQIWHVLDEQGREAPDRVAGQLYIGGAGVALGYLHDEVRTAEAFVCHPRTGERLYRTGDLGCRLPSGDIEFLGRSDFQVKIQGYRVEPGEIEHVLSEHPAVGRAAVVARASGAGRQLAAFVTPARSTAEPEPGALRAFLARRLPSYLVPGSITVFSRLPLTANGKLDRRALEELRPLGPPEKRTFVTPRTELEAAVAGIWEETLSITPVGADDDFFALGGQSFAALRIATLLSQRLGRRVSLGTLLECRTVASLAARLMADAVTWSPLVKLREDAQGEPWFFVHPAGGNVLCYRQLAELLGRPFYAFQAPGPAVGREPLESVEEMAAEYVRALRELRPHGPYLLGGWSSGGVIAFEMAHQLESRGEAVGNVAVIDAPAPVTPRPIEDGKVLLWFFQDLDIGLDPTQVDAGTVRALLALPEEDRLPAALRLARELRADEPALDPSAMAPTLAVFRAVIRACNAYRAPGINAGMTVVRARQGSLIGEFCDHPFAGAPDWGWASLTTGAVAAIAVDGTHHSLLSHPEVAAVSEAVASAGHHGGAEAAWLPRTTPR
jgi:pyochelin synthetase